MGRLSKSQGKLGQCIAGLGGTVVTKATEEVDICISKKGKIPHVFEELRADSDVLLQVCISIWCVNFGEH